MVKKLVPFILILLCVAAKYSTEIKLNYPFFFPEPQYDFTDNSLTKSKIELGRFLFYDPLLSKDKRVSCASCHSPFNSFAHTDHQLSHGINDEIGDRNAPALFNLAWHDVMMWDGAINHIDMQALAPLSHPKEMGESLEGVINKIRKSDFYKKHFYNAFSDSTITGVRFLKALSSFQLSLISVNSKYDRVMLGKEEFSKQEERGYALFCANCNSCHREPLFSTFGFASNELPVDSSLRDYGRMIVTSQKEDSLLFKIPTLRNLSYTFPYMHDGRFLKLRQVLDHYTQPEIQERFKSNTNKEPVYLSSEEKADLISFLLTLNDKDFVFNPKHQFPKELIPNMREY